MDFGVRLLVNPSKRQVQTSALLFLLRTEYTEPCSIEAISASRLIPLDKGEGAVRKTRKGRGSESGFWSDGSKHYHGGT